MKNLLIFLFALPRHPLDTHESSPLAAGSALRGKLYA